MYVCLCNGYRDEEIREVAESGVRCAREAYLTLGNGPCCGTCLDCAQEIVDSVHAPSAPASPQQPQRRPQPEMAPEAAEALLMAAE
jgi:bacterioferritin-associated ferredoxin